MSRLEKRAMEKIKKKIMKSKKIPAEKKAEVLEAFSKVDLSLILNDPSAMADVLENPGHLINYVTDTPSSDEAELKQVPEEETEYNSIPLGTSGGGKAVNNKEEIKSGLKTQKGF